MDSNFQVSRLYKSKDTYSSSTNVVAPRRVERENVSFPVAVRRSKTPAGVHVKAVLTSRKAGVNMKAVFWLGIMFLMQISRLRFKQSRISLLISHIYVLGCFVNFLVIFRYIWREIVFLKGLVKLMEIGNFEDLLLF